MTKIKQLLNHLTTNVILLYLQTELIMAQNILNSALTLCILLYFEARNVRRDTARCAEKFTRKSSISQKAHDLPPLFATSKN